MATSTRGRRNRPAEPTETVQETTVSTTTEAPAVDLSGQSEATEGTETPEKSRPGRKPMDQAEREKRATYRACEKAVTLLEENGFAVTKPANWEDPEAERLRENAKRALAELAKAGIDVSSLGLGADATATPDA